MQENKENTIQYLNPPGIYQIETNNVLTIVVNRSSLVYDLVNPSVDTDWWSSLFSIIQQGHTAVLVGIKAEIGKPRPLVPDEGYLEFFVDW